MSKDKEIIIPAKKGAREEVSAMAQKEGGNV